jgi:hypothetical protein
VLALALVTAAVPVPVLAQEKSPPATQPGIQASVHKALATTPMVLTRVKAAKTHQTAPTAGTGSWLKTPAGIVVLAIVGVGAGYAAYSASHNRVHSAARANQ